MAQGTFLVREVGETTKPPGCILVGDVRSGTVAPGMLVSIPLNGATSIVLRIKAMGYWEHTRQVALSLECEGGDTVALVRALNVSGEELECRDTTEDTPE